MKSQSALPLAVTPDLGRVLDPLPFASPGAFDPGLEAFLQEAAHHLCRWLGTAADRPPLPGLSLLPEVEPQLLGVSGERLLADLQLLMEGSYNPGHPGALAHLDPPPLTSSLVADLVCAGLNNNLLAEELSPTLSRLERSLCGWLARRVGLGDGASGVPASGGSLSNLMALVTARHSRGLQTCGEAVVIGSADLHVSIDKALVVMGLAPEALRRLPVDAAGRLDPGQLERELIELERRGRPVIAVVASAGTTVRGAVDPLTAIAAVCRRHGVWLHVDGAIGGVLALSERHRERVEGIGLADSITLNPQKLLGITKTSSLLLLADPGLLPATFATGLPYMEPSWGPCHGGESGLQGSRSAEILKLWLGLRQLGLEGIDRLIEAAIGRRRRLRSALETALPQGALSLLSGPLHLLAFRPAGLDASASASWSAQCRADLMAEQLMLSRPLYHGHHHLKAVLGNPHTGEAELEMLVAVVKRSLPTIAAPNAAPNAGIGAASLGAVGNDNGARVSHG
ncbi:aminotransferase class V-fold PLP-dependent enzyme [Synechococcus sp. CS-602]|uniref:pyridoxal phosphate-dependent decarboxylase family protein n=1 Tax=Synechococcaceae TaxID=1890426 RepID=UPI0008FF502D|nr:MULTISPECIES: pyridoxal-dependent decarboxylase [Synechococcaceae]MCT4363415.1 pyridoxal-dependent decarboxylase [Candidatus Regnicoccus frigidus MAG-AL1]MCT0202232.1 aminotransferase class V-fold PLP-dependent enzyme [Synechococcus sp. CS-603]MCT0205148.1 aminotransferase class V-fold PLP-dependent enzyme [Synechococcus sp. CS-602]MCT0245751.1 aminotransferase class V-fold PLP-dependent enzyme [Synechococcus sp. CS-601]MCT4367404.1 pyridoxal-dependent decarboxylase [Candidatus Regnicoccus 